MKNRLVKIGMGQLLVEGGEPERNLARAHSMIDEAAEKKCHIILLPECLDLAWTHPSAKTEAKKIPGPYSDQLCQWAQDYNIYICAGLTETEDTKVYNSALFINPQGKILLKYRKINVLKVGQAFYSIGQSLNVVETPFGIVGVNICSDNYLDGLPIGHTLARMGCELLLSPSSWTVDFSITEAEQPYGEKWIKPYSLLAKTYNLVIVGTTSVGMIVGGPYEGKKMVGCSLAVNREGILQRGTFNEFAGQLVTVSVDVPVRSEKGTEIGEQLQRLGYNFENPLFL